MEATELYFSKLLYIVLHNIVLAFECLIACAWSRVNWNCWNSTFPVLLRVMLFYFRNRPWMKVHARDLKIQIKASQQYSHLCDALQCKHLHNISSINWCCWWGILSRDFLFEWPYSDNRRFKRSPCVWNPKIWSEVERKRYFVSLAATFTFYLAKWMYDFLSLWMVLEMPKSRWVLPPSIYVWQLFRNPTQEGYFQVQPVHSALAIFYAHSTFIGLVYCSFVTTAAAGIWKVV